MFAKVFTQILDSSLANDWQARHVFEDMLKLAEKGGIVDMTHEAIARRTNVPIEIVRHGISELEKPDPVSRTPDEEGRRIVRMDAHREWGWRIVNYDKYRTSASLEMLRMSDAERKRAYRARFSPHTPLLLRVEEELESEQSMVVGDTSKTCPRQRFIKPTLEELKTQSISIGLPESEAIKFYHFYESKGWKVGKSPMVSWKHAMGGWKHRWSESNVPRGTGLGKIAP